MPAGSGGFSFDIRAKDETDTTGVWRPSGTNVSNSKLLPDEQSKDMRHLLSRLQSLEDSFKQDFRSTHAELAAYHQTSRSSYIGNSYIGDTTSQLATQSATAPGTHTTASPAHQHPTASPPGPRAQSAAHISQLVSARVHPVTARVTEAGPARPASAAPPQASEPRGSLLHAQPYPLNPAATISSTGGGSSAGGSSHSEISLSLRNPSTARLNITASRAQHLPHQPTGHQAATQRQIQAPSPDRPLHAAMHLQHDQGHHRLEPQQACAGGGPISYSGTPATLATATLATRRADSSPSSTRHPSSSSRAVADRWQQPLAGGGHGSRQLGRGAVGGSLTRPSARPPTPGSTQGGLVLSQEGACAMHQLLASSQARRSQVAQQQQEQHRQLQGKQQQGRSTPDPDQAAAGHSRAVRATPPHLGSSQLLDVQGKQPGSQPVGAARALGLARACSQPAPLTASLCHPPPPPPRQPVSGMGKPGRGEGPGSGYEHIRSSSLGGGQWVRQAGTANDLPSGFHHHQATKVDEEAWARADTPTQPRRGDASSTLAVSSPPSPSGSIRGWRGLDSSGDVARDRVVGSRYVAPSARSPADGMPRHSWAASQHSSPRTFEFDAGAETGTDGSPCHRTSVAGGLHSPAREVLRSGSPNATGSLAARQRRDQASRDTQQRGPGPGVAPCWPDTGSSSPGKAAQAGVRQTSPALRAGGAEPTARVEDQVHRQLQQAQAEVEVLVAERSLIILTSQALSDALQPGAPRPPPYQQLRAQAAAAQRLAQLSEALPPGGTLQQLVSQSELVPHLQGLLTQLLDCQAAWAKQLQQAQDALDTAQREAAAARQAEDRGQQALRAGEGAADSLVEQLEQAHAELAAVRREGAAATRHAAGELAEAHRALRLAEISAAELREQLVVAAQAAARAGTEQQAEVAAVRAQCEQRVAELRLAHESSLQQASASLQQQHDLARQQWQRDMEQADRRHQQREAALQQELEAMQAQHESSRQRWCTAAAEAEQRLAHQASAQQQELAALRQQQEAARQQWQQSVDEAGQRREQRAAAAEQELAAAKLQLLALQAKLAAAAEENSALQQRLSEQQVKAGELNARLSKEVEELREDKLNLQVVLTEAENQLAMVHEDVQRVRHRHLTLSDQMSKSAKLHEARHSGGYVPDLRQLPYTKTPQLGRAQSPVRQVVMQRMGSSLFSRRVPVDVAAGRR